MPPEYLEAACAACPYRDAEPPSDWFAHISYLHALQEGGYPFQKNDLTIEEWLGLAELRRHYQTIQTEVDRHGK
jgi:hypothetical protein